jgi:hypothetical protein
MTLSTWPAWPKHRYAKSPKCERSEIIGAFRIEPYSNHFWAIYDETGALVCVTVYRRGAREVARRLTEKGDDP